MERINTITKGDLFEARAFDLIQKQVNEGRIPLISKYCHFRQRPKYYSKDRLDDIIFDISIEITPKGASNYHLLYLIECKDYAHKIPVDDLEEFKAKIDQVAGKNVKGVFMCTSGFQSGAYSYAKSQGIMLIQVSENDTPDILLHNAKNNLQQESPISWSQQIKNTDEVPDGTNDNYQDIDWDSEIKDILSNVFDKSSYNHISLSSLETIEKLTKQVIHDKTIKILNDFDPEVSFGRSRLMPQTFLKYINDAYGIEILDDSSIPSIRGVEVKAYCSPKSRKIYIDPKIREEENFLFVCIHEMAHIFLHANIKILQEDYDTMEMSKYNALTKKHDLINDKNWIEWQANHFAASLLMPIDALSLQLIIWQKMNGINRIGEVFLDNQNCNKQAYVNMADKLSSYFNVSKATLKYRLDELGLIQYSKSNPVNWRDIVNPNNEPEWVGDIVRRIFSKRVWG